MKRLLIFILSATLLLGAFACTKQPAAQPTQAPTAEPTAEPTPEPDPMSTDALSDIMAAIIKDATGEIATAEGTIDDERFAWFFNMDPIEGAEAYSSEALINIVPHSVALLRVPEGTDAQTMAKEIEEKADPRKWVCVEAEKTIVKVRGNVVLLVMAESDTADRIAANFEAYR